MPKPLPMHIKRLCTPWLDQLRPLPEPCSVPQPCPLPHVVPDNRILIGSLFMSPWSLTLGHDWMVINFGLWAGIGVKTLILIPDALERGVIEDTVKVAKGYGMQVGISLLPDSKTANHSFDAIVAYAKKYADLADYWYVSEVDIGSPFDPAIFINIIRAGISIKHLPVYISPYCGSFGEPWTDEGVRERWGNFVAGVSSRIDTTNIISALQDGCGCPYFTPRRTPRNDAYRDFLRKAIIHRQICEQYGWRATVNVEFFAMDGMFPATPERIKAQVDSVSTQDYVSAGLGLGPCWEGVHISASRTSPQSLEVYQMLWKMRKGVV
jgi:hypothetical protein